MCGNCFIPLCGNAGKRREHSAGVALAMCADAMCRRPPNFALLCAAMVTALTTTATAAPVHLWSNHFGTAGASSRGFGIAADAGRERGAHGQLQRPRELWRQRPARAEHGRAAGALQHRGRPPVEQELRRIGGCRSITAPLGKSWVTPVSKMPKWVRESSAVSGPEWPATQISRPVEGRRPGQAGRRGASGRI